MWQEEPTRWHCRVTIVLALFAPVVVVVITIALEHWLRIRFAGVELNNLQREELMQRLEEAANLAKLLGLPG